MITLAEKKIKIKCPQLDGYFVRWYHNGWHHWFFYAGDEEFATKGEWHNTESQTKVKMGCSVLTCDQVRAIRTALFALRVEVLMADGWKAAIVDNTTLKIYDSFSHGYSCEFTITIYAKVADYTPVTPPKFVDFAIRVAPDLELTDLDILRLIRAANPTSNLPILWDDAQDPYTEWEWVTWNAEKTKVIDIDISSTNTVDLSLVYRLTSLETLYCNDNKLTSLDVHGLNLKTLNCSFNDLTSLSTLTSKGLITQFGCSYNWLPVEETDRLIALGFPTNEVLPQNS